MYIRTAIARLVTWLYAITKCQFLARPNNDSDCSIRVYRSFKSEWQHKVIKCLGGESCPYHTILLYFVILYVTQCILLKFASIISAFYSVPSDFFSDNRHILIPVTRVAKHFALYVMIKKVKLNTNVGKINPLMHFSM